MTLLVVEDLRSGYRGDVICDGVSLTVAPEEIVCVLGRNGVGKSTLLKSIVGLVRVQSGSVRFADHSLAGRPSDQIARLGIGYVPQGRQLFGRLSVRDNLRLGAVARDGRLHEPEEAILDHFPVVRQRLDQRAGTLSGGEQQMVAIARTLMARPRLILCDEPSEGLQPSIVDDVGRVLQAVAHEFGTSVLLVEQNIRMAAKVASRGYIIEGGRIVEEGPMERITSEDILNRHVAFSGMIRAATSGP